MADAQKDADQSMEDILQSIKRIIADEGDVPAPAPPTTLDADVLELTELLAEDVAVPAPQPSVVATLSLDEIMAMPDPAPVVAAPPPAPEPLPATPEPVVTQVAPPPPAPAQPAPVAQVQPAPAMPKPAAVPPAAASVSGGLISESTLAASMAALNALLPSQHPQHTSPSPVFRSGATVEDLALEAIRPVVKEWLDTNLPGMVRQMVEREIRRIRVES